ncbi:MAG: biotin/lipoyl-binding protein [Ghiorsea sp.]|nr:biotin/lipoyl-binding protein [Ghiorsea sp.]
MNNIKQKLTYITLIAAVTSLAACSDENTQVTQNHPTSTAQTMVVHQQTVPAYYTTSGTVTSDHRVSISSRLSGYIRELTVREGDQVKAGQILVHVDPVDANQALIQAKADLAAATELAIADVLVKKSMRACKAEGINTLVIAGGVAANQTLRIMLDEVSRAQDINVFVPDLAYCTDNAAMIAYAGALRFQQNDKITSDWDANPRWKLTELT